jgi:hypothetical protein
MEHYIDDPWYASHEPWYESRNPGNVELGQNEEDMYYRMLDRNAPLFPNLLVNDAHRHQEALTVDEAIALFEPREVNQQAMQSRRLPGGCTRILKHTRGGRCENFKCPTHLMDAFLCNPRNACDVKKALDNEGIDRGDCRCGSDKYSLFDPVVERFSPIFKPNAHSALFEYLTVGKAAKVFQHKPHELLKVNPHAPLTRALGHKIFKPCETMLTNSQANMLKLAFAPHTADNSYARNLYTARGKSFEHLNTNAAKKLFIPGREELTDPRFLPDIAKVNYHGSNVMDIDRVYGTTAQKTRYPTYTDMMKYGATTTNAKNLPYANQVTQVKSLEEFSQDPFYDHMSR